MTHTLGRGQVLTNISVDRIDSDKDYIKSNIQFVCLMANLMKHKYDNKNLLLDKQHISTIVENAYDYFNKVCDEEIFKKNYKNMLDEFEYLIQRWKEK